MAGSIGNSVIRVLSQQVSMLVLDPRAAQLAGRKNCGEPVWQSPCTYSR